MVLLKCFDPKDIALPWSKRSAHLPPRSIDELRQATHLLLAHHTTDIFLSSIRRDGLSPSAVTGLSIADRLESDLECVYLASRHDTFYFQRAVDQYGGEGLVVLVQVETEDLLADENMLSPSERDALQPLEQLYRSLCAGACKHRGPTPTSKVVALYDFKGIPLR
jgi:hypothetical protein